MAKTATERVKDYRRRHPGKARKYYAVSKAKKKARREAEKVKRLAKMAVIFEAAKMTTNKLRMLQC